MKRFVTLLFAALLLLSGCAPSQDMAETGMTLPIYFLAPAGTASGGDALVCSDELLLIDAAATLEEQARAVVERVLQGSSDGRLPSPFPEGTELLSLSVRNRRVQVDLTGIARLDGISLTLADYCLTLSLASVEGVDSVSITCDGRLLAQQPRRVFYPRDVLLSTEDNVLLRLEVMLFFLNEEGVLTPETRILDLYEGETQSAVVLDALLAGPEDPLLMRVIPEDFVVSSIRVEDGVCRINLPAYALASLPEDEETQHLILWSLTESLYSLAYIDEIRLMADGEELEFFGAIPVDSISERPKG